MVERSKETCYRSRRKPARQTGSRWMRFRWATTIRHRIGAGDQAASGSPADAALLLAQGSAQQSAHRIGPTEARGAAQHRRGGLSCAAPMWSQERGAADAEAGRWAPGMRGCSGPTIASDSPLEMPATARKPREMRPSDRARTRTTPDCGGPWCEAKRSVSLDVCVRKGAPTLAVKTSSNSRHRNVSVRGKW